MAYLVRKYLDKSHFSEQKNDFSELYTSHPNYPGVFAITEALDSLSIANAVVKIPKEQFVELPEYFLTLLGGTMVLAQRKDSCVTIEFENRKKQDLSFNEFLTQWDQVIIVIEPNEVIGVHNESLDTTGLYYVLPAVVLITVSLLFHSYNVSSIALLFTSLVGLIAGVLILQERFGYSNALVSKICRLKPNISCTSVINSDSGKKWIQFSDLPFLFFGISVAAILFQPNDSAIIVGFLSVFSLPILLYSIWIQKTELKKWCVLCLVVSFIVVLQVLIFTFGNQSFTSIFSIRFFEFLFFAILFTSLWMLVKPVFDGKITADQSVVQSIKFKRNFELFTFLAKKLPSTKGFNQLQGLFFGNKNAETRLTIIISPSCMHCHTTFEEACALVAKFPERVFLNVLFNIDPENKENPYRMIVENLMVINNSAPEKAMEALVDWFGKKMEFEEWKAKWACNIIEVKVKHQMKQQYNWCQQNDFNYTPVKIVNEKLLPEGYEIGDLKYFLNDFSNERERLENSLSVRA